MKFKKIVSGIMVAAILLSLLAVSPARKAEAVAANGLKTGTNYEIIVKSTGMAMTVSGYSNAKEAEICQMPANQYASQIWTLDSVGGGYYRIVNKSSGMVLNVPRGSVDAGTAVIQWNKDNSENSQWMIEDVGDGFCKIIPKLVPEFGLNIEGNSKNKGAKVIQWTYAGANNEKWEFREVGRINDNPGLETPSEGDVRKAVDAWLAKFYYTEEKNGKLLGKMKNEPWYGFWTDAEILEVMIDAYERLGDSRYLTVAEQFYDGFIDTRTTDWRSGSKNEYNDDILWMSLATIRLYLNTHNEEHYKVAKFNIEDMYNTQWDDKIGGGLWWKNRNRGNEPTKNTCVNGPGGLAVYLLAEAAQERGDSKDAAQYYAWGKNTADWLINVMLEVKENDGRMQDNVQENGKYGGYVSTGTQGNSLGVFTLAYKHTKDTRYLDAAKKVGKYTSEKMGDGVEQILNREYTETDGCGGKGILGRWIGYFVDETKVTDFNDWILTNAKSAWTNRNEDNLMWSRFGGLTPENIENSSMAIQGGAKLKDFAAWNTSAAVAWLLACPGLSGQSGSGSEDVPKDTATTWNVLSPNQKTAIKFELKNGSLYYTASQDGKTVVESSPLGIKTSAGDFTGGLKYESTTERGISESYDTYSGKKDRYTNHCQEKTITFTKDKTEFSIIARAYNDGVAFRYGISTGSSQDLTIAPDSEVTGIKLPDRSDIWEMSYVDDYGKPTENFMYEQSFNAVNTSSMDDGTEPTMPMLYKSGDKYTLVTEAQKSGSYVGSHLKYEKNDRLLRFRFDKAQKDAVKTKAPFQSPWRSFVIGSLDTVVNNTMVENLSPAPDAKYDFASWVEPGVSSWSWVANWGNGISDQANPDTHKKWIDLAADMGWKFYILDEKWQPKSKTSGSSYEGMYDWFPEVAQYAKDKGVKLIAWVNKSDVDTKPERETRFKEWSEAGIAGIKVDFFYNEKQSTLQLHEDIYADAAKYRLLVNVHGSNPPSGEIRTYPNVIAREAIRGQETGGITANQYTILPFTRGAVGTADVTEEIRSKSWKNTTMGFQVALSTLFENGIHSLGSQPQDYYNVPAGVSYYKNFPARWDDVKYLDSQVGAYVNLARRANDVWYAAGISVDERDMKWKPDFLDANTKYTAVKYVEISNNYNEKDRQDLKMEIQKDVTSNTELSFHVQNGGGYAVKLVPQEGMDFRIKAFPSEVKIQELSEKQLRLSFTPEDTTLTDVTWNVEKPDLVQVSSTAAGAVIKGLKEGKTKVTAESVYDKSKKAEISVEVTKGKYALDTGTWEVFNNNYNYSLNGENSISIQAENGVIDKNVFAMKAPSGDFTITGKISGELNSNYQGGFIGAFVKGSLVNNYVSVGRRYHTSFDTGGSDKNNHIAMMSGQNTEFYAKDDNKAKPVYVKLEKKGTTFTGYYSYDNNNWTQVTGGDKQNVTNANIANNNNLYIGFYAGCGGSNAAADVTIEDFTLNGNMVKIANTNEGVQQAETFTVEFDSAGGTSVPAQFLQSGQKAARPADPTKANAAFIGWYAGSQPYDFNTEVKKDILLTAKWTLDHPITLSVEGEAAKFENGAALVKTDNSSNGYHIGNMGGKGNGTVTFTLTAEAEEPRNIAIYYATIGDRKLNVTLNGKSSVVNCPESGSWTKPGKDPVVVEVILKRGENVIQFSGVNEEYAPNIDRFELLLTKKEAINVVTSLIERIPERVTDSDEDKALIHAVKLAYDGLDEKIRSEIENADKLNEALQKLASMEGECQHEKTVKTGEKEASCQEDGYSGDIICTNCNLVLIKGGIIPATGIHTWDEGVVTKEAAPEGNGEILYTCEVCGEEMTHIIEWDIECDHIGTLAIEKDKRATCAKDGYTGNIICTNCGQTLVEGKTIPMTDAHEWDGGTLMDDGSIIFVCTVCKKQEIVSKNCKHKNAVIKNEKAATCKEDGYTGDWYCKDCDTTLTGGIIPATGNHKWDAGEKTSEATPEKDGEITFTCTVCQEKYIVYYSESDLNEDELKPGDEGEQKPGDGQEPGSEGEQKPGDGQEPGSEGEQKPGDEGEQKPGGGQPVKVTSIKITGISKKIAAGKKVTLKAKVMPVNASNATVTWSSSNTKYARVNAKTGRVSVKKAGKGKKVTIYAAANDGSRKKASYKITIMPNAVKKVKIQAKSKSVKAGSSLSLKAVVTPKLSSKKINAKVQWSSNNANYAKVTNKGVVKTKKAGKGKKVKITAKATDGSGKKATIKISIK